MKWSKVKKLVEESFAESIRDRIHIYSTAYLCSCGRAWITIDGKEVADLNTLVSGMTYGAIYHEATKTKCVRHPAVSEEERVPGHLVEPGEFSRFDLHGACWQYLHDFSLNDALASNNPLIKTLAVLNKNVGKNRLQKLCRQNLHPLTRAMLEFRMKVEGIT